MEMGELRPRLWHWRARHPDWEKEGPGSGWEPVVESYAYVTPGGDELVLVDPLVPKDDADTFWRALERDVEQHGAPQIVLTVFWHERSAPEILERHGGTVWSDTRVLERLDVPARGYSPGDTLPGGLVAHDAVGRRECVLWLDEHRALFTGDILHGGNDVRLCPDDWFVEGVIPDEVRRALAPLLELPVELVLTTHGEPVLENGRDALARALAVSQVYELRPGLWTWTAAHPSWSEKEEWGPEVRSYAYDTGGCLVLFDPISPPTLLEGLIEAQELAVLLTAEWHRRSADECVERFGAHVFAADEDPPAEVERRRTYYDDEVAYWIPRHAALVVGDAFLNEDEFQVQDEWLPDGVTAAQMREGLRSLLELPVELVLPTHGDPLVEDAHATLGAALEP